MGNFGKWLGAGLGYSFGGPIGSVLGFAVGSLIDGFTSKDVENARYYKQEGRDKHSGDFEISLLILASVVIKSDGNIDKRELDYVRTHFIRLYGEERAKNAFKLFKSIIKGNVSTRKVCIQIRQNTSHASRLQLIHFLFGIAKADGQVNQDEIQSIRTIANYLYINTYNFESIKAMFFEHTESAYTILEITTAATDKEVKKAYRKLVKKHHPDKLQHLGEEHIKGALEKFRQIQEAYEKIQKERGFV